MVPAQRRFKPTATRRLSRSNPAQVAAFSCISALYRMQNIARQGMQVTHGTFRRLVEASGFVSEAVGFRRARACSPKRPPDARGTASIKAPEAAMRAAVSKKEWCWSCYTELQFGHAFCPWTNPPPTLAHGLWSLGGAPWSGCGFTRSSSGSLEFCMQARYRHCLPGDSPADRVRGGLPWVLVVPRS